MASPFAMVAAKRVLTAQLRRVAHSARVMAKTVPDADAKFPLPTRQSDTALLQAGLLFVKEVGPPASSAGSLAAPSASRR